MGLKSRFEPGCVNLTYQIRPLPGFNCSAANNRYVTRIPYSSALLIMLQICFGIGSLACLAFAPPARGEMLLVPIVNDAPVARLARERDALLVSRGPAEGLVVRGDRNALFWPMLRAGVMTLAAPASVCGGQP
ncbi:hypothetical protein [Sphingomonas sp. CCH5-D11]|uniref:hypothetical protein n=1 Tax=Sphingomonas sp. CCH5-D11 TaxID=1768786 RepID=UPI001E4C74C3|nr:hypothetical protein [Sphingomonas sp. CCH5-D11]